MIKINKELEKDILNWHKNTFQDSTLESQFDKLKEEIQEVRNSENMRDFYSELSDCYIVAYAFQRWSDYAMEIALFRIKVLEDEYCWEIPQESFEKMIAEKLEINKKRKWKKINNVYHHV